MARASRITAGMVGAVVGALVMDAVAVAWGGPKGGWAALKCPTFPFAMHAGFNLPVLLASQLSHLLVALFWGIVFGLTFAGKRAATVLLAGPLWGMVVLVAMYFVVLPAFSMGGYVARSDLLLAVALHLGYGVGLSVTVASLAEHRRSVAVHGRGRVWAPRGTQTAEA